MKKLTIGLCVVLFVVICAFVIFSNRSTPENKQQGSGQTSDNTKSAKPVHSYLVLVKNWEFEPRVIRVKHRERVVLRMKSVDVKHGVRLDAFKIDLQLMPFVPQSVEFTADRRGTFDIICTLNCGPAGYKGMKGMLIVE